MKHQILFKLQETDDFVSGGKLAKEFGLSRTAIWKHIHSLMSDGYEIESVTNKGYRLISSPDIINYDEIKDELETKIIGRSIYHYKTIDSTNKKAKELAPKVEEGTVVVSEEQTSGRGRLGRSWNSKMTKGIYTSIIVKPKTEPDKVAKLTLLAAAAVFQAFKEIGIDSTIKWPNDILVKGKKVAGILTEMNCELGIINHIVLGIGINVNHNYDDIPEDLREKATSLKIETGEQIDRKHLFSILLNHLDELYIPFETTGDFETALDICRDNSAVIGVDILVVQGHKTREGRAISINHNGELMVHFEDGLEPVLSGEVSIRKKDRYI